MRKSGCLLDLNTRRSGGGGTQKKKIIIIIARNVDIKIAKRAGRRYPALRASPSIFLSSFISLPTLLVVIVPGDPLRQVALNEKTRRLSLKRVCVRECVILKSTIVRQWPWIRDDGDGRKPEAYSFYTLSRNRFSETSRGTPIRARNSQA